MIIWRVLITVFHNKRIYQSYRIIVFKLDLTIWEEVIKKICKQVLDCNPVNFLKSQFSFWSEYRQGKSDVPFTSSTSNQSQIFTRFHLTRSQFLIRQDFVSIPISFCFLSSDKLNFHGRSIAFS